MACGFVDRARDTPINVKQDVIKRHGPCRPTTSGTVTPTGVCRRRTSRLTRLSKLNERSVSMDAWMSRMRFDSSPGKLSTDSNLVAQLASSSTGRWFPDIVHPRVRSSAPHRVVDNMCPVTVLTDEQRDGVWCCGSTSLVSSLPPARKMSHSSHKKSKKSSKPPPTHVFLGISANAITGPLGFRTELGIGPKGKKIAPIAM